MENELAHGAIKKNIERADGRATSAVITRAAYLCDAANFISDELSAVYADIFDGICTGDDARGIYAERRADVESKIALSNSLPRSKKYISHGIEIFDSCFICSKIHRQKYSAGDAARAFFGAAKIQKGAENNAKIAFVAGKQANAAFEMFARFLGTVSAFGVESFSDACDAASEGDADYCIVPLENSAEGRLDGFYNAVGKAGLYPLLGCRIGDGDGYTRFVLFSRRALYAEADGTSMMQIRLTADRMGDVSDILSAADFFGADVTRIDTIPLSAAGRENSIDMIFKVNDADIAGFITFLRFEYPQFYLFGIFTDISEGGGR